VTRGDRKKEKGGPSSAELAWGLCKKGVRSCCGDKCETVGEEGGKSTCRRAVENRRPKPGRTQGGAVSGTNKPVKSADDNKGCKRGK